MTLWVIDVVNDIFREGRFIVHADFEAASTQEGTVEFRSSEREDWLDRGTREIAVMAHPDVISSPTYDRCQSPGVALIIVIKEFKGREHRSAADKDLEALSDTFGALGFQIETLPLNATDKQILAKIEKVRKMDHNHHSAFVLAVSSHGSRGKDEKKHSFRDAFCGANLTKETACFIDTVTKQFSESQCRSLKGKPKLFFIQACRGEEVSVTAKANYDTTTMDSINSDNNFDDNTKIVVDASAHHLHGLNSEDVPMFRDCLMAYSCPPGYKAFGKEEGSWFIQKLCQVLTKQHEERDLESMLIEVNHRVATEHITKMPTKDGGRLDKKRSVPWVASMLTKQVWFYPPEKNQNLRLTDHRN